MKDTIGAILWLSFMLALVFLLQGDPDLWDLWHQRALSAAQCGS